MVRRTVGPRRKANPAERLRVKPERAPRFQGVREEAGIRSTYPNIMARKVPTGSTIKALFAKSGNRCSFPGCQHLLVNGKNQFIANICHIQAANVGGPRYNPDQTDDERRDYKNLILLCYQHHVETNDVNEYPVEKLINMKHVHETSSDKETYVVDESFIGALAVEMDKFWSDIELLNTIKHVFPERAVPIDTKGDFLDTIHHISETLDGLETLSEYIRISDEELYQDLLDFLKQNGYDISHVKKVPYYDNPFVHRNWEVNNIGFRNSYTKLRIYIVQLQIQYLEEYIKVNSSDKEAMNLFERLKNEFRQIAQNSGLAD